MFEAAKKSPSGIGKIKTNAEEKDVEFIAGDVYDLSGNNRYTDKFTYYSGKGDGYIMDKDGKFYDVITSSWSSDAGRIAGGSMNYQVTIKKANGTDDAIFSGWSAIFSTPHYAGIIEDIKAGYYLEDYIAKNWGALSHPENFEELKKKGDANAKSHTQEKVEDKEKKEQELAQRYIILPKLVNFIVKDNRLDFENFTIAHGRDQVESPKDSLYSIRRSDFDSDEAYKVAKDNLEKQWEEYNSKLKEIQDKLTDVIQKIATNLVEEYFKVKLDKLNGLKFYITPKKKLNADLDAIAIDTKKNKVVTLARKRKSNSNSYSNQAYTLFKDINENPEFEFGVSATVIKNKASDYLADLFKRVSDAWQKINSRTKTKYIEDNWEEIWKSGRGYYPWNTDKYTKGESKKMAEEKFYKWLNEFNWSSSRPSITFSTDFIKDYIKGELPQSENEKKETSKQTTKQEIKTDVAKARKVQEPKMDAWHNGTRNQNVTACSDAKLKLNYEICKDKGYTKEAEILKKEADSRGLKLESLNLENMRFSIIEQLYLN